MKSNRLLKLSSFVLTLGITISSVPMTAFKVDFKEPVYKLPVLQPVHYKFCKVVGIKDVNNFLVSLPEKAAESEFGEAGKFIVEPWTKLACSRMKQGYWIGGIANNFIIDPILSRYVFSNYKETFSWAPEWWPLSWKALVKKCLTHVMAGSSLKDSLVREVLNTFYKNFILKSIDKRISKDGKVNSMLNYAVNVYAKYAVNRAGKYAFNQILP